MAGMIDGKPENLAEAQVWESLRKFLPDSYIVYHNREINGREFDYCVFLENIGILIIEVKGWSADRIRVHSPDSIEVAGYRERQRSPRKQARAYRFMYLDKIKKKYNESPLVFDMVCYPYISRQEYLNVRLDIVSEEMFTIFREDLSEKDRLLEKIGRAYTAEQEIGHADFTAELMLKLRRDWEPDPQPGVRQEPRQTPGEEKRAAQKTLRPYSVLSVHPSAVSAGEIREITEEYFGGTKRILFLESAAAYDALLQAFGSAFREHNLRPDGSGISIGYREEIRRGTKETKLFNLEIYLVERLSAFCGAPVRIEEGRMTAEEESLLRILSKRTSFNLDQYLVEHAPADQNTMVIAGAGTGKTYSMVSRIAYLCGRKDNPVSDLGGEIAMVTFTNDAADNMKSRIRRMFSNYFVLTGDPRFLKFMEEADRAEISTIHKFVMNLLRKEVLYTGLGINFRIKKDENFRREKYSEYLGAYFKEKEEKEPGFAGRIPVPVYDLRNKLMELADRLYERSADVRTIKASEMGTDATGYMPYFNELIEKVVIPAEKAYLDELHVYNDLMLSECTILLDSVLDRMEGKIRSVRYRYLFVDEFQDTDDVQIRMFQRLQKAMETPFRIFAVGDLKQSIYRFRGATLSAFDRMRKGSLYPWKEYRLNINYRTDFRLLNAFAPVFADMGARGYLPYREEDDLLQGRVEKETTEENLFSVAACNAGGREEFSNVFFGILDQQKTILEDVIKERERLGKPPLGSAERTIAVLVRSNWQVDRLMEEARRRGVGMRTNAGGDLFQLAPALDLYKLVTALNNSSNPVCLVNFIESNYTGLKMDYQRYHGEESAAVQADLIRILDEFFVVRMGKIWREIVRDAYMQPVLYVLKQIYDSLRPWMQYSTGITGQKYYRANYECLIEHLTRDSQIGVLTMNGLEEYLRIAIATGQEKMSRPPEEEEGDVRVLCTTVHKAKGLEYGVVILPYTNDSLRKENPTRVTAEYTENLLAYAVPFKNGSAVNLVANSHYQQETEITEQIREEARVLYVALTRAIRSVIWVHDVKKEGRLNWARMLEVEKCL